MLVSGDNFETYYADKLWSLLPAMYRAADSDVFDRPGPLRELVNRLGAQAAILRRSIDRLWDDQSIETCDAWLIPYIADLLATNLVSRQDVRAQRLDVAKTIYYRRRKGTVALLEELASDVTGWSARAVEFFRRLGRYRHNLDPEIGLPAATDDPAAALTLQLAEGLVGAQTRTPLGGWADLRRADGATQTMTAFDEFSHTADFRRGRGKVGWHNLPRLGVFLWRLRAFAVVQATPVELKDCPGQYTFDPTGREIPLFAAGERAFGTAWVSPSEWQLPTPISRLLLNVALPPLYADVDPQTGALAPRSLAVFDAGGNVVPVDQITADPSVKTVAFFVDPEHGRLVSRQNAPNGAPLVSYHYGFSSTIGAGPYDRRVLGEPAEPFPAVDVQIHDGGGALDAALATLAATGERVLIDSLTYDKARDVAGIDEVRLSALNRQRPLIRLPDGGPGWAFTGNANSQLTLTGLFLSGGDLILRGEFDTVTLRCCTLDPGTANRAGGPDRFARASDHRSLVPTTLWVEGVVRQLVVDRCITGPIRTRRQGEIADQVTITDSVVQVLPGDESGAFQIETVPDLGSLAVRWRAARDPVSRFIQPGLSAELRGWLPNYDSSQPVPPDFGARLVQALNDLVNGPALYDPDRFARVQLSTATRELIDRQPVGPDLARLNRLLLRDAYPLALTDLALGLASGTADLSRITVLGPSYVHRLSASECVLDDVLLVEDSQHGCVRFSAWATGSALPRRYESAEVGARAPLFTSVDFGQPGYAQLLAGVDSAIVAAPPGVTVSEGAPNGSEMGAFARELNPIKERGLRSKFDEYVPLGLTPVLVHVT